MMGRARFSLLRFSAKLALLVDRVIGEYSDVELTGRPNYSAAGEPQSITG